MYKIHNKTLATSVLALSLALGAHAASAQGAIELHGASQFGDDHAFTKSLVKFGELIDECYDGTVNIVMHKNSELGLEKQYFEYMSQGQAVDFAIVSPAHMSTFSKPGIFIERLSERGSCRF